MTLDREALKAQLRSRSTESYNRREAWADTTIGIFDTDASVKQFAALADKATAFIDVIPFIAGRYWPTRLNFGAPGQWAPHMELFVHSNVGSSKASFACPLANWGQPCPICEQQSKLREKWSDPNEEQKQIIKSLYPQRRCLYNVVHANDEKTIANGVQVLNLSHFSLQRQLESLIVGRSGAPEIFYADPDEGKTIRFTRDGTGINTSYIGISFIDRDYTISEEELAQAYVLDEILALPKNPAGDVQWNVYYTLISSTFFSSEGEDALDEEVPAPTPQPAVRTRVAPMSSTTSLPPPASSSRAVNRIAAQEPAPQATTEVNDIEGEYLEPTTQPAPTPQPTSSRGRIHRDVAPQPTPTSQPAPQTQSVTNEPIRSRRRMA